MNLFLEKKIREKHYLQLSLMFFVIIFYFVLEKNFTEIFLFTTGFVWQWSSQFEYIQNQSAIKKYRFSFVRFYFEFVSVTKKIKVMIIRELVSILAPVIFMGLVYQIFNTPFFIHEILLGSVFMRILLKIKRN
jgi:hypothetical protein